MALCSSFSWAYCDKCGKTLCECVPDYFHGSGASNAIADQTMQTFAIPLGMSVPGPRKMMECFVAALGCLNTNVLIDSFEPPECLDQGCIDGMLLSVGLPKNINFYVENEPDETFLCSEIFIPTEEAINTHLKDFLKAVKTKIKSNPLQVISFDTPLFQVVRYVIFSNNQKFYLISRSHGIRCFPSIGSLLVAIDAFIRFAEGQDVRHFSVVEKPSKTRAE